MRGFVTGLDGVLRGLESARLRVVKEVEAGLFLEGNAILTISKRRFVPVDFGTLRSSGFVRPTEKKGSIGVEIGFGGAAGAYALAVHEHPSEHSPPSWKHGVSFSAGKGGERGPQYLTRAVEVRRPVIVSNIQERIAKALK